MLIPFADPPPSIPFVQYFAPEIKLRIQHFPRIILWFDTEKLSGFETIPRIALEKWLKPASSTNI